MKRIRLDKLLADSGLGSRKETKALVRTGAVSIDGRIVKDASYSVNPQTEKVFVDEKPIDYREYYYLMLNKPAGVISATRDNLHETVVALLPEQYRHAALFPVGRLDKDTEGLLLLSNDGQLAHQLLSPRKHVPKTYLAQIDDRVTDEDIALFQKGLRLADDFTTLPSQLKILTHDSPFTVEVTIYEGKYHQVKRMFAAVEKHVLSLKRLSMGSLHLDEALSPGQVRELTPQEIAALKSLSA